MFLVLEGVDCSGKTSIGKEFAKKFPDFEYYATPPRRFLATRSKMDRDASDEDHYTFYRDAVFEASQEIETLRKSGKSVICDRYWLTTYVYHVVMGLKVDPNDFAHILQPDLTVLLRVGTEVQDKRLGIRGLSEGDRRMLSRQHLLAETYELCCKALVSSLFVIDTDELTLEEVIERIAQNLV